MVAFILATDFDFIAYMSKMTLFWEAFFTPMAFLEYDTEIPPGAFWAFPRFGRRKCMPCAKPGKPISPMLSLSR